MTRGPLLCRSSLAGVVLEVASADIARARYARALVSNDWRVSGALHGDISRAMSTAIVAAPEKHEVTPTYLSAVAVSCSSLAEPVLA